MSFDGRLLANVSVLAAVVESGGFASAGDALGMSSFGVSRAIARLESRIGVRLLDRTTRSVTVTAGASAAVRGRLRVNVDSYFARLMLAPYITPFLERYPKLSLELVTRDQLGDMVGEGFDIAIRFGQPPSSSLVARKLLETAVVTVASPAYLHKHGQPQTPAELEQHACIQMRNPVTGQPLDWEYKAGRKIIQVKTSSQLLVTEAGTLLSACLAGAGIARLKASGVQTLIEQGQLVQLLPEWAGEVFPLYALYPSRHLPAAKVRAFIDYVVEVLET